MTNRIILTRGHGFDMGTFGRLSLPGFECVTCERPWAGNKVNESCIPSGVYTCRLRNSEIVRETTHGTFSKGWEVTGVHGRTYIMLHPGNTIDDTAGCILPGEAFSAWDAKWTVTNSRDTFRALMDAMAKADEWRLDIRYFMPEYP